MKILKIFMIVTAIIFVWLIVALFRTTVKTVAERKSRPPVAATQEQQPPQEIDIERPRSRR